MAAISGTAAVPAPAASRTNDDISLTQRMISASFGSILTSILVTPLDVVRVRLQSQSPAIHNTSPFTSHTTQSLKNLPPNLGVTACCREVFWIGDNAPMCILAPTGPGTGTGAGTGTGTLGAAGAAGECAVEETQRKTFNSTFDGLRKIARHEGALTLWRGLSPTLMMGIPANVIYFAGYDWLRFDDKSPIKKFVSDAYAPLIAGSFARIAAATAISPIEMFRTRLQATPGHGAGHFRATLEGLYHMTQANGYSSLWRGLTLTMWRDVPFSGMYWWGYEEVKKYLVRRHRQREYADDKLFRSPVSETLPSLDDQQQQQHVNVSRTSAWLDSFIAGAVSGSAAALVTTPFDVGKTRQQVFRHLGDGITQSTSTATTVASTATTTTTAQALNHHAAAPTARLPEQLPLPKFLMHIFREEGMAGLFRGWVARCLKVAPACAIMISTYEAGKMMARGVNERRLSDPGDEV